jgi:cullin-associated NEDD8-dissociated protein 1
MDGDNDDDEGWGEDYDDEDDIMDDDDTSWKVRRAAIKVLDAIFSSSRSELLHQIYREQTLFIVDRFKERDENVKILILSTFTTLL